MASMSDGIGRKRKPFSPLRASAHLTDNRDGSLTPMSDDEIPQSPAPSQQSSAPDDQAARIEQLLMAGLDEYFAGRHDRAVQVWSRVFFLDRTNARARADIERARGAVAERQRLAEAASAAGEGELSRPLRDDGHMGAVEVRPAGHEREGLLVVSGA